MHKTSILISFRFITVQIAKTTIIISNSFIAVQIASIVVSFVPVQIFISFITGIHSLLSTTGTSSIYEHIQQWSIANIIKWNSARACIHIAKYCARVHKLFFVGKLVPILREALYINSQVREHAPKLWSVHRNESSMRKFCITSIHELFANIREHLS